MSPVRAVIIDDHLLLGVLLGDEPAELRPRGAQLLTTGLWYHRLCRALTACRVAGSLSQALGGADPQLGSAAIRATVALPETIGLISLRDLAWPMARLIDEGIRLNLLSLEAIAAADSIGAEICLAAVDTNPPLIAAAGSRGIPVRLVA